jgi:glycosyltransferase involved in cell wall biosynthesis
MAVVTVFGLASRYIGGSESYARELSIQLGDRGEHSVLCFLNKPPKEVLDYLDLPNVTIEVLEGVDAPTPSVATIRKLSRILRKHKAQILHLHLVGFLSPFSWLARSQSVKGIFFSAHGSHPEGYVPARAPAWKRALTRLINGPMTGVICVSDFSYRCMRTLDILPSGRFHRIYNGVDLSRVSADSSGRRTAFRRRHGIGEDVMVVTQVSWLISEKGVEDLIGAARLVLAKNPNVHFVLVGEGEAKAAFQHLSTELGIEDHFTWTGLVNDPIAEGVYDGADIVCQASRWEEAFGQVIAEAMACGRPVIGTRVGGIPEVIDHKISGFLVNRREPSALAEAILTLASNSELRARLGANAQSIVRSRFDLRRVVEQVIALYQHASVA